MPPLIIEAPKGRRKWGKGKSVEQKAPSTDEDFSFEGEVIPRPKIVTTAAPTAKVERDTWMTPLPLPAREKPAKKTVTFSKGRRKRFVTPRETDAPGFLTEPTEANNASSETPVDKTAAEISEEQLEKETKLRNEAESRVQELLKELEETKRAASTRGAAKVSRKETTKNSKKLASETKKREQAEAELVKLKKRLESLETTQSDTIKAATEAATAKLTESLEKKSKTIAALEKKASEARNSPKRVKSLEQTIAKLQKQANGSKDQTSKLAEFESQVKQLKIEVDSLTEQKSDLKEVVEKMKVSQRRLKKLARLQERQIHALSRKNPNRPRKSPPRKCKEETPSSPMKELRPKYTALNRKRDDQSSVGPSPSKKKRKIAKREDQSNVGPSPPTKKRKIASAHPSPRRSPRRGSSNIVIDEI